MSNVSTGKSSPCNTIVNQNNKRRGRPCIGAISEIDEIQPPAKDIKAILRYLRKLVNKDIRNKESKFLSKLVN